MAFAAKETIPQTIPKYLHTATFGESTRTCQIFQTNLGEFLILGSRIS